MQIASQFEFKNYNLSQKLRQLFHKIHNALRNDHL